MNREAPTTDLGESPIPQPGETPADVSGMGTSPRLWGVIAAAVTVGLAAALVLVWSPGPGESNAPRQATRPSEATASSEVNPPGAAIAAVVLDARDAAGNQPFTSSVAVAGSRSDDAGPPPVQPTPSADGTVVRPDTPGLFGGTMNETACDSKKLIGFLQADQDKGRAWAGVFGISAEQIPEFVGNLTPVILRTDTRVTNHGYVHGHLTTLQSVLESGTAVMLDESGQPAVRCACGNPLSAPVSIADPTYAGAKWRAFNPAAIFVIASPDSNERIKVDAFGVWDLAAKALFWRHRGALIDDVSFTASVVKPPHDEEDPPAHNDDDHDHHHDDPRVTLNLPTTIGIPANDNDDHDDDDDHDPDDPRVTLTLPTSVGIPTKHISQATS